MPANRVYFTISNTPGTSGNFACSAAVSGYRSLGAADNGKSFDVFATDGTAWEVRTDCVYTHSTATLTRGTLEESSTGAAINLTGSAKVGVTLTEGRGSLLREMARERARDTGEASVLVIGGDHPYVQWGGLADAEAGMARGYLDRGITPYMAINTDPQNASTPGAPGALTWEQVRDLQAAGVEIVSHGNFHVSYWQRPNTGVRIEYSGGNSSASVHVQNSGADVVLTLTDSAPTALTITGKTLTQMKGMIEAVSGWTCTIADELLGTERAETLLRLSAARSVKSGGSVISDNTFFACGGGIQIAQTGTAYRHAWFRRRDSGTFELYGDGRMLLSVDLGNASYNTLTKLQAAISGVTGFTATMFQSEVSSARNFIIGDELSLNLHEIRYAECGTRAAYISAGLPLWYMQERQFVKAKETAAANGVKLDNWAQSGADAYGWTAAGHDSYGFHRVESYLLDVAPKATHLNTPVNWMPHRKTDLRDDATTPYSSNALFAMVDALCASKGFAQNVLIHALKDGSGIAALPALANVPGGSLNMYADDWVAFIDYIGTKVASGELQVWTHARMLRDRRKMAPPRNLIYNPIFANQGGSLIVTGGSANAGQMVPGWRILPNSTFAAACYVDGQSLCMESTNLGAVAVFSTQVLLTPGVTYEFGVMVELEDVHATASNSMVQVVLKAGGGAKLPGYTPTIDAITWRAGAVVEASSAQSYRIGHVNFRFTCPQPPASDPPTVVSSQTLTTVDMSTNKNIKVNILSKGVINIDCSTGAASASAVTPGEICRAINEALSKASAYGPDFGAVATHNGGVLRLAAPYSGSSTDPVSSYTLTVAAGDTNSIFSTLFGSSTYLGVGMQNSPRAAGMLPFDLIFYCGYGKTKFTKPYCVPVSTAF